LERGGKQFKYLQVGGTPNKTKFSKIINPLRIISLRKKDKSWSFLSHFRNSSSIIQNRLFLQSVLSIPSLRQDSYLSTECTLFQSCLYQIQQLCDNQGWSHFGISTTCHVLFDFKAFGASQFLW